MAIPVAAPRDPAGAGSVLEDAYAAKLADTEAVWERLAIEIGTGRLRHLSFARAWTPAQARRARVLGREGESELGPAADMLLAQVRAAVVAERRAYAEGLLATGELARVIETQRRFDGPGEQPGSPPKRLLVAAEYTAQVLAFELGVSTGAAMDRLGRAWALCRLPRTLAGLHAGWLGIGAVNALVRATAGVDAGVIDQVEAGIFDALGHRRLPDGSAPLGSWSLEELATLAEQWPRLGLDLDTVATPAWVRARARTQLTHHDPQALKRQARAARSQRQVRTWDADQPGMAWLAMLATTAEVAACYARINTEATSRHRAAEAQELVDPATGELPTLGNTRADVMTDLLLGPRPDGTPGPAVNVTVHLIPDPASPDGPDNTGPSSDRPDNDGPGGPSDDRPGDDGPGTDGPGSAAPAPEQATADGDTVDTADGDADAASPAPGPGRDVPLPDGEVRVDHLGAVLRDALDDLVRLADRSGGGPTARAGGRVRVRTVQPVHCPGHPAGTDPGPYRPSPDLAARVIARDLTCRWPGCTVPAQSCDLDHSVPWPAGPTCLCNLAALCRRHHRVKTHHPGWTLTNHGPDGRLTWTTPTGRAIDTHPGRGSPSGRAP